MGVGGSGDRIALRGFVEGHGRAVNGNGEVGGLGHVGEVNIENAACGEREGGGEEVGVRGGDREIG